MTFMIRLGVGLKLNARKCKTLRTEYAKEVEGSGEFPYLL